MEKGYNITMKPFNPYYLIICFEKDILNDMISKGVIQYSKNLNEDILTFIGNTLFISSNFNLNNEFKLSINDLKEVYRIISYYYYDSTKIELKQDKIKKFKEELLDYLYEFYPNEDYNDVEINIYKNNIEILFNNKSLNYYILENELEISIEDTLNLKDIENLKKDIIKLQDNIEDLVGRYKCSIS